MRCSSGMPVSRPRNRTSPPNETPWPLSASAPSGPHVDQGLTGTNRERDPGCDRPWPPVGPATPSSSRKLDRLARSLPDARAFVEELTRRNVKLSLGGAVHDPTDPVGRLPFNVRRWWPSSRVTSSVCAPAKGMRVAKAKGRLRGKQPKLNVRQETHLVALHRAGAPSVAELGDLFGVTRSTVYRAIQRDALRQRAGLPGRSSLGGTVS